MVVFQYDAPNIWSLRIACCPRWLIIGISWAKQILMLCPTFCFSSPTIANLRLVCHYFFFTSYPVSLATLSFLIEFANRSLTKSPSFLFSTDVKLSLDKLSWIIFFMFKQNHYNIQNRFLVISISSLEDSRTSCVKEY